MNVLIIERHSRASAMLERVARQAFAGADVHCVQSVEAAKRLARRLDLLSLVLLDLDMPGCSGADAVMEFREAFPNAPVVVVCGTPNAATILAALKAGAAGYIPKAHRAAQMAAALQLVMAGCVFLPPEILPFVRLSPEGSAGAVDMLTDRQREVLRLLLKGHSNPRIADELHIALGTVKHHVHALLEAFRVSSRSELIATAASGGVRADGTPVTGV